MGNSSRKEFCTYALPAATWLNWMSSIPDERSLADLSIPGTNNTMCSEGWTRCQTWPLAQQYEAGIRFVDIRCQAIGDELATQSRGPNLKGTLEEVLTETLAFLKDQPTETVILYIRDESDPTQNTEVFQEKLAENLYKIGDLWFWDSCSIPTLGQVRGKMVILQNCTSPLRGIGSASLDLHDEWVVPTLLHVGEKWVCMERRLKAIQKREAHLKLYLTFCTGISCFALSESMATWINLYLYTYLESLGGGKNMLGVVAVNLPGAELVQRIIRCNEGVVG